MEEIVKVLLVSASPVLELRGGIPLALSLGIRPLDSFLISLIGNALPVPFLLCFFSPLSKRLRRLPFMRGFFSWFEERTKRRAKLVEKFEFLGLILFVAIPLPTTGAWTGAFAASLFKIRFGLALLGILLGLIFAGLIVIFISLSGFWLLK